MDPVTAIGLVASIIQFVDVGSKIISTAREIYGSSTGMTREAERLQESAKRLREVSITMMPSFTERLSLDQQELQNLARECRELSEEMLNHVQNISHKGSKSHYKVMFAAIKTQYSDKDRQKGKELERRLNTCHSQMYRQYSKILG
jgi:hypothetical protein